jgi:predicted pyridoxine 5'-phosphate oxidase superfamily flavin-nucleotide-binding protein
MTMPYHRGERLVQERAGAVRQADHTARVVRPTIPDAAAMFLADQPMFILAAIDHDDRLWVTQISGPPGLVRVIGESTILVTALPAPDDPVTRILRGGGPVRVGTIAIELESRRRLRLNGSAELTEDGVRIRAEQVIANCPKYIQSRRPVSLSGQPAGPANRAARLSADLAERVTAADTFFVATADDEGNADASHRGGNPGFVEVISPTELRWPDYAGNSMFLTLGNLEVNPRAGLLLPHWETGGLLRLTGTAEVDWDPVHATSFPGAQRLIEFHIDEVVDTSHASPLRWSEPEYSRFNRS